MTTLSSNSIETLATRIRRVPLNGTLRFLDHPQSAIILEIVKMFIETDYFAEEKFEIELSNDYAAIKKKVRFDYEKAIALKKLKDEALKTLQKGVDVLNFGDPIKWQKQERTERTIQDDGARTTEKNTR